MRNNTFGRLLKGTISSIAHYEGKTAPILEDELGQQIGVTGASIQRYKAGHLPPEPAAQLSAKPLNRERGRCSISIYLPRA
jgi:hypothetical protein